MDTIKIVLVDDEILFRKGIYFLLQREDNIEIIHESSDGEELLQFLNSSSEIPDIILMDLKMPLLNGVEATKIIRNDFPDIKIIALTSYNTDSFIANMINVGASSYLVKNATTSEMILTINEVAKNGFYYNDLIIKIINTGTSSSNLKLKSQFDNDYISTREKEVLNLICQQKSTNEIAEILYISPRTVEGHRNSLLLKTESKNIAGLVVYAFQNKLVQLDKI
jgi:DNA-binding NarL/FixJ family response regulator